MDKISKTIDFDDWYTTQHLINILEQRWGKISFDRFASDINRKSKRHLCPETEGRNAFSFEWSNEANLLVPPTYLIPRPIKHFLKSRTKSKAILICPYWPSAPFWPLLASGDNTYFPFVKHVYLIENPATCIKLGDSKKSILGSPTYQGYFIAILMIKQVFPQVNKNLVGLFDLI